MMYRGLIFLVIYILPAISLLHINKNYMNGCLRRIKSYKTLKSKQTAEDDAISRRRKRRQSSVQIEVPQQQPSQQSAESGESGASLEDKLGLGNQQLRELLEQELPVPRENLATRKVISEKEVDKNKAFQLPDLNEFIREVGDKITQEKEKEESGNGQNDDAPKIDRSNKEEYMRVIQLNPFADADDSIFLEEYDIFQSIFGTGKLLNVPVPYLQTGHGILLVIVLLAAFIYYPGNPLTEFPPEIRAFFRQGLMVTYSINLVLAAVGYQRASSKNLPGLFWAVKCFLLGGVAFYEVTQARDPKKMNEKTNPADRKSKSRRQ